MHDTAHGYFKDAKDPTPGLHIDTPSTLLIQPSPQPPASLENLKSPYYRAFKICLFCLLFCLSVYLESPCLLASSPQMPTHFRPFRHVLPFLPQPKMSPSQGAVLIRLVCDLLMTFQLFHLEH